MQILFVTATFDEILPTLVQLGWEENVADSKTPLFSLKYKSTLVDVIVTGPGINNTAFAMGRYADKKKYDLAINAGICGSFNRDIALGCVVQIVSEQFGDMGAEDDDRNVSAFDIGLLDKDAFPYTDGKLQNKTILGYKCTTSIMSVSGLTVNRVHGNERSIEDIIKMYHTDVESMEGAAFFYASLMQEIPFIQLRSVSNYVEKRNKQNWNIKLAVTELNKILIKLIEESAT